MHLVRTVGDVGDDEVQLVRTADDDGSDDDVHLVKTAGDGGGDDVWDLIVPTN